MQAPIRYDWDDLEVGQYNLNHSENFFAKKHTKHEQFSDEFENKIPAELMENQENDPKVINQNTKNAVSVKKNTLDVNEAANNNISEQKRNAPANVAKKPWTPRPGAKSPQPMTLSKKPLTKSAPSHLYGYKDIYLKKKQEQMNKLLEEEKKQRVFHSRPVPNYTACHKQLLKKQESQLHQVTIPTTPLVLKKSRETDEKRRIKMEEWKKRNQPLKFTARDPSSSLKTSPFKPKKTVHLVESRPFNLHLEARLSERKQYDEEVKRKSEELKKQVLDEESERQLREIELVKEFRKLTTFKATPNPFK